MSQFRHSSEAEKDIEGTLIWTHREFGKQVRVRYEEHQVD